MLFIIWADEVRDWLSTILPELETGVPRLEVGLLLSPLVLGARSCTRLLAGSEAFFLRTERGYEIKVLFDISVSDFKLLSMSKLFCSSICSKLSRSTRSAAFPWSWNWPSRNLSWNSSSLRPDSWARSYISFCFIRTSLPKDLERLETSIFLFRGDLRYCSSVGF